MKINYDCVRDVLFYLENKLDLNESLDYVEIPMKSITASNELSKYTPKDIAYTIYKLAEAEYIIAGELHHDIRQYYYSVRSITYSGHEFIESVRTDKKWTEIKKVCSVIGGVALSTIKAISQGMTTAAINVYLQKMS